MLKGRTRLLFSILALVALVGLLFVVAAPVKTEADLTGNASPSVTVTSGGSLALSNLANVQWGNAAAGTTKNGTINCTISCNTTTFDVKVATSSAAANGELAVNAGTYIPSSAFTYGTTYNSGTPNSGPNYQASGTQFATTPGTNVVNYSSAAANNLNTNCSYTLNIPPTQAAGSYTATHTYTLTPS